MFLQGIVLSTEVRESGYYDQLTGELKPGYSVELTVIDAETDEKYKCQLSSGFARLEQLKEMQKQKQPLDALRQVADQLRAELPPKFTTLPLHVMRIKGKSAAFLTLVCQVAEVAAAAAA